jgi:hypothetical protein
MTKSNTTTARRSTANVEAPTALRIPLSVLATLPEKLRTLAETIKIAAKLCDADYETFRNVHGPASKAYTAANGTANCAVNSFAKLNHLVNTLELQAADNQARAAAALTSAIYNSSGNIHNDDCFKATYKDAATVEATIAALHECGDNIRAALRPFGY